MVIPSVSTIVLTKSVSPTAVIIYKKIVFKLLDNYALHSLRNNSDFRPKMPFSHFCCICLDVPDSRVYTFYILYNCLITWCDFTRD